MVIIDKIIKEPNHLKTESNQKPKTVLKLQLWKQINLKSILWKLQKSIFYQYQYQY